MNLGGSIGLQSAATATLRSSALTAPKEAPIGRAFERPFQVAYEESNKQQELLFLEQVFRQADLDGSGLVSAEEFAKCMNNPKVFQIYNQRFGMQRHETPRIFRALDTDCSGDISVEEWLATCKILMSIVKEGDVITNWRINSLKEKFAKHSSTGIGVVAKKSPRRAGTSPGKSSVGFAGKSLMTPR
mmetsp:Transcript_10504/g.17414  ORF Transcript_10504/g.17414 Transcript_10504/m.17414 type:complete len:187 (+) Transcript_10504:55-615(+)